MNPLIEVDVTLYFEVSNSEMYGGQGTVGYSSLKYGGIKNLEAVDDSFVRENIHSVAQMMKVTAEDVRLISKEEYDLKTEDENEDED